MHEVRCAQLIILTSRGSYSLQAGRPNKLILDRTLVIIIVSLKLWLEFNSNLLDQQVKEQFE